MLDLRKYVRDTGAEKLQKASQSHDAFLLPESISRVSYLLAA